MLTISDFEKLLCRSGVCTGRRRAKRVAKVIEAAYAVYGTAMFAELPGALIEASLAQSPESAAVISLCAERWLEVRNVVER